MPELLVFMVIAIVLIITVGGVWKRKYEAGDEVSGDVLAQMQARLSELKKSVGEIKEYITDFYIQQHDEKLK